jgi:hypothetical protein
MYQRANPFTDDVRAWNAYQVYTLNNLNRSRGVRISVSRAPRGTVRGSGGGGGYRSRGGDVENNDLHGRPLDSPKFACEFDRLDFSSTCHGALFWDGGRRDFHVERFKS